ncbi:electron transport protein SCO1/SenC [Galbibacter marinus]|uniref:Electron transport protein SCO1/SenC n=1 Tax=Galbibacter marinus TaxID=555500 RepID=K2P409_9FLAO|nr:electron transport protein SCO1/SenC [Galbibacter marinus]
MMNRYNMMGLVLMSLFISCNTATDKKDQSDDQPTHVVSSDQAISDMSIYNLPSQWTNQDGKDVSFLDYRGKVLVSVMIYTSCQIACPRLVADMRTIKDRLPEDQLDKVQMLLISIDPETDTPERLKSFAIENHMDQDPWVFLRSSKANTREFAAVLAVNYRKISPIDFSHSNIISVFNEKGELAFQQEGINVGPDAIVKQVEKAISAMQ